MDLQSQSRDSILTLMDEKNRLEAEIEALMGVLTVNGVGMHGSLVDEDDYPRNDIDVFEVRHARHQVIRLQNDHKALMKEIEQGIHALHSVERAETTMETECSLPTSDPIALVNKVSPGSPAADAGLKAADKILEFGTVNACNFQSLQDISFVTSHSVGKPISLLIQRDNHAFRISLTPRPWGGAGLLGCHIVMPENVDR